MESVMAQSGIAFFNYPDQMDDAFICIISVFAALQDKGAESKFITFLTAL